VRELELGGQQVTGRALTRSSGAQDHDTQGVAPVLPGVGRESQHVESTRATVWEQYTH
jgi:hypothetical protein